MKNIIFYWPLIITLVFYSVFSFLWGNTGVKAVREMELRKKMLENNLTELNIINKQLNEDLVSLSSDPERIVIQSRNIGYLKNEEMMLFVNINGISSTQLDVGKILHLNAIEGNSDIGIKWISFIIFSTGMIFNFLYIRKTRQTI